MQVPQPITDALNALQADADQVAADRTADDQAAVALAAAQQLKAQTAQTLASDLQHEATDLQALVNLIQATYGTPTNAPSQPVK